MVFLFSCTSSVFNGFYEGESHRPARSDSSSSLYTIAREKNFSPQDTLLIVRVLSILLWDEPERQLLFQAFQIFDSPPACFSDCILQQFDKVSVYLYSIPDWHPYNKMKPFFTNDLGTLIANIFMGEINEQMVMIPWSFSILLICAARRRCSARSAGEKSSSVRIPSRSVTSIEQNNRCPLSNSLFRG